MTTEIWQPIAGYAGYYLINSVGVVMSVNRKVPCSKGQRKVKSRIIEARINNRGYKEVRLSKDGFTKTKLVHILTAEAFVPNPLKKPEVNHIDGNKLNNCSTNVEWATHSENIKHAYRTGLIKKAKPVVDINSGMVFESSREAAKLYKIKHNTLRGYLNGQIKNKTGLKYKDAA